MIQRFLMLAVGLLAVAALGCASDGHEELTADGLERLRGTPYRNAWVKPHADFQTYTKITLAEPAVRYRRPPKNRRTGSVGGNFALSDRQMKLFKELLIEAFEEEFAKSKIYGFSTTAGPEVLLIEPAVIDLIVNVPTEDRPGRERVYTTSTADMTLMMELRDSETKEILARIADRQRARQAGSGINDLYWSNSVSDVEAVRRTFRRWARILREQLDDVHAVRPDSD